MRNIEELGEAGHLLAEVLTFTVILDGEDTASVYFHFIFCENVPRLRCVFPV